MHVLVVKKLIVLVLSCMCLLVCFIELSTAIFPASKLFIGTMWSALLNAEMLSLSSKN